MAESTIQIEESSRQEEVIIYLISNDKGYTIQIWKVANRK